MSTFEFDNIVDSATQYLLKNGEHPMVIFALSDTIPTVIHVPFVPDTSERRVAMLKDIASYTDGRVHGFALVTEGYAQSIDLSEFPHITPSIDDLEAAAQTLEVLTIGHVSIASGEQTCRLFEILRNVRGDFSDLLPMGDSDDTQVAQSDLLDALREGYLNGYEGDSGMMIRLESLDASEANFLQMALADHNIGQEVFMELHQMVFDAVKQTGGDLSKVSMQFIGELLQSSTEHDS